MSTTTARLYIDSFTTALHVDGEKILVVGDGDAAAWQANPTAYLRRHADVELTRRGYTRIGDWSHDRGSDCHTATISPTA